MCSRSWTVYHQLTSSQSTSSLTNDAFTGVKNYNVSLDSQTVDVTTEESVPYSTVLEKISKTGKKVNSGEADGVSQSVEVGA